MASKIEPFDGLFGRKNLVVAVRPAEPRQIIPHRRGQIPHRAISLDPKRTVALGELRAVRPVDQRNMREGRRVPAHGIVDLRLPGRVREVVVAANDMRDAHVVIVDHNGEHIGRRAVGPQENHVVEVLVLPRHAALNAVLHHGLALARSLQAHGVRRILRPVLRPALTPRAIIAGRPALLHGALAHRGQFLRSRVAAVGFALLHKLKSHLTVPPRHRKLVDNLALPIEFEPFQPVDDGIDGRLRGSRAIRVLDAEQKLAACVMRVQPIEQRGAGAANVQKACRRGCKACHHARCGRHEYPLNSCGLFPWAAV